MEPSRVLESLKRSMLVDGLPIVLDLERSRGSTLVDARDGRDYVDFHGCFATSPLGWNHPTFTDASFRARLARAAIANPTNADFYTVEMADFVDAFRRTAQPPELPHLFLVSGGTLAVENALKAAFDWKVRKNLAAGRGERGSAVIHFREAFHGRSGYCLSLTNTFARHKVQYFPKFDWPRVSNPKLSFPTTPERLREVEEAERRSLAEIRAACDRLGDDVACLILEPIQSEGGDNHFRPEFLRELRKLADERGFLLILDEVQTGLAASGTWWCYQQLGIVPDIVAFGKKVQVCGIMASPRLDEVDSVFKVSGRINSTWGGNLGDMVRSQRILETIAGAGLLANARDRGASLLRRLDALAAELPGLVSNVRGRGLLCAFDLPATDERQAVIAAARDAGLLLIGCGDRSIRFRPALTVTEEDLGRGFEILRKVLKARAAKHPAGTVRAAV